MIEDRDASGLVRIEKPASGVDQMQERQVLGLPHAQEHRQVDHKEWLDILGAAGDSGELGQLMNMMTGGSELAGQAGYAAVKWVWNNISPFAVVGLAAPAAYGLWRASPATRQHLLNGARSVGEFVGELYVEHLTSSTKFKSMVAQIPSWAALADTVPAEQVRARASMYTLARSMPDRSAAELAEVLPDLPVSTSEATARATLRQHACFHEVYQGRWRIGHPAHEGWQSPMIFCDGNNGA